MNDLCSFNNNFIIVIRNNNGIVYMNNTLGNKLADINLNDTYILLDDRFYVCKKEEVEDEMIEIYYDVTDYLSSNKNKRYVYDE